MRSNIDCEEKTVLMRSNGISMLDRRITPLRQMTRSVVSTKWSEIHDTYDEMNHPADPMSAIPAMMLSACTSQANIANIPNTIETSSAAVAGARRNQCGVRLRMSSSWGWR